VYDKSARIYDLLYVGSGIKDYPAEAMEPHRLRLTETAHYVSAITDAGLQARVIPDYMPNRDRIVGIREQR
jgi:hypothetical protein